MSTRTQTKLAVRLTLLALLAVVLGCATTGPKVPTPSNPFESIYMPVASADTALWWPLLFSGFLAIAAGLVNSFIFGKGLKLFIIGVILASIPPVADHTLRQSALFISLTVLAISVMLIVWVGGKWFGWRWMSKEMKPITQGMKEKKFTPEEAADIIESTVLTRPRKVTKRSNKGVSS
tara:strand:+ start:455 stop:988 length:534 start_codon:yes stop_codon:yes gene_type:complete